MVAIPPVVQADWLAAHPSAVVADVRWYLDGRSGREAYLTGHLPGAVFVDLDTVLAAHGSPEQGRHPLPSPDAFATGLGALGIGDDDTVVAYDDAGGVIAARLVWMLRAIGREAALLDGGIGAWSGPLQTEAVVRPAASFTPVPWPADRLASIDDATDPRFVVLDARPRERFQGEDDVDARAGHIPGARNVPCRENLDATGRFLPVAELREVFAAAGVTSDSDVVSSCGSGVTACHNLLGLELAGFGAGRLYPGSWSQYAATDRPVATGP